MIYCPKYKKLIDVHLECDKLKGDDKECWELPNWYDCKILMMAVRVALLELELKEKEKKECEEE